MNAKALEAKSTVLIYIKSIRKNVHSHCHARRNSISSTRRMEKKGGDLLRDLLPKSFPVIDW